MADNRPIPIISWLSVHPYLLSLCAGHIGGNWSRLSLTNCIELSVPCACIYCIIVYCIVSSSSHLSVCLSVCLCLSLCVYLCLSVYCLVRVHCCQVDDETSAVFMPKNRSQDESSCVRITKYVTRPAISLVLSVLWLLPSILWLLRPVL